MPTARASDLAQLSTVKASDDRAGACAYVIDGCMSGRHKGGAFLARAAETGVAEPGPCVVLFNGESDDRSVILLVHAGGPSVPEASAYPIATDDPADAGAFWPFFLQWSADQFFVASPERGVVTVSSSSPDRLRGTFEFEGNGCEVASEEPPGAVHLAGSFAAPRLGGEALRQKLSEIGLGEECAQQIMFSRLGGDGRR